MSIIKGVGPIPGGAPDTETGSGHCLETRVPLRDIVRQAAGDKSMAGEASRQSAVMHFPAFAGTARPSTLGFEPVAARATEGHAVAPGYRTQILLKSTGETELGDAPAPIGFASAGDGGSRAGTLYCLTGGTALSGFPLQALNLRWTAGAPASASVGPMTGSGVLTPWRTVVTGGGNSFARESRDNFAHESIGGETLGLVPRPELGTLMHVGMDATVNRDGRAVLYFADGAPGGSFYRLVTLPKARTPLEGGTLSVARFLADGTLDWRPLIWRTGPLGVAGGMPDAAHLTRETGFAATQVGATPIARVRDIATNPANRRIYLLFGGEDASTIVEIAAPDHDHTTDRFTWKTFIDGAAGATPLTGASGLATDPAGRLWISSWPNGAGMRDAATLAACDADGPGRAMTQTFFRAPAGAQMSAPVFTPNGTTMFVAVHKPAGRPMAGWPDFAPDQPARSAILAITRDDGGLIGS